ncbi:GAF domain-containing sensor histidine kinase [Actinoplanes friuliensis]|uniref:histidine kinase n=1 Tax=Actinoplanes friuliensis DSM 7358 TaxID=1246995 RepID=U5VXL2_9ACTN|nr:histidine kinase [Actinoplanes friuliensis]AGZ41532.1 Two component signal transduction histidine kinase [Actinoplanes friuliensis DSM 7358]
MTRTAMLSSVAGAATAVLVAGGFALGLHVGNLHNGLIAASFTAVGLFVLSRRPGNREGLLFLVTGTAHAVMFAGRQYALHDGPLPGASWAGWLGVWPLPLVLFAAGLTLMCFPDGRLPSRGWRPVAAVLAVVGVALSAVSALWPVEYARTGLVAGHPLDLPGFAAADAFYSVARPAGYLLFQLTWAACVVVRLRRARGDEARQLRWFVYAVTLTAAIMVVGLAVWGSPVPGALAMPAVAVVAGAAILKYRLYDIDLVINKSLVLGAMATIVTLGYVAVVTGVGRLVGGNRTVLSVVATAIVAVAFEPLRRRVQRLADRIVYGHRVSPYESLARLSAHLAAPDAGLLLDGICRTVADGVGAREVVLSTGPPDQPQVVSRWPDTPAPRRPGEVVTVPVRHDGRALGTLTVRKVSGEALSGTERKLVGDLAAQAGLVLELRATAQRLVTSADAARRRLERDLHDGAQQRLVTVAMELGAVVRLARDSGAAQLADRADSVRAQLLEATADLREMARGLHPAVLTQDGLEAALGFLADRSPVPVRLGVTVDRRLRPEVEATAYFMVSEGLTNTAKHASAGSASVRAELADTFLIVEVADDGIGGATMPPGSGLEGLADRLAALGARLTMDSGPSGTRLTTVIPCA